MDMTAESRLSLLEDRGISSEHLFIFDMLFDVHSARCEGIEDEDLSIDGREMQDSLERFRSYFKKGLNAIPLKKVLDDLMEHGMIVKKELKKDLDWDNFNPSSVSLNKNFLKQYREYTYQLGKELKAVYPKIGNVDGKEIPLTTIKKLSCEEELFTKYAKLISNDIEKHRKVLDLIRWSVEENTSFTNMSLETFVLGSVWEAIEEFRGSGASGYNGCLDDYYTFM